MVKIKEIIESGALGDIYYVSAIRVNLGIHQKDVSVVWDLAPHDLSMLFYWLDEAPSAVAMMGGAYVRPGISDVAFMNLQFASRDDRELAGLVAVAEQAAPDHDRRARRRC